MKSQFVLFLSVLLVYECIFYSDGQSSMDCVSPYTQVGTECYFFSTEPETTHNYSCTWINAKETCERLGGLLAILDTEEKNDAVANYLTNNPDFNSDRPFWIGLYDQGHEGVYVWDGTGEEAVYTSWYPGLPNGVTTRNCIVTSWGTYDNAWGDDSCALFEPYICQQLPNSCSGGTNILPESTTPVPTQDTTQDTTLEVSCHPTINPANCQYPFVLLGESCYYFSGVLQLTNWWTASEECIRIGGTIATIDTEESNTEIINYVNSLSGPSTAYWIGANDQGHVGLWIWAGTGGEVDYSDWSSGFSSAYTYYNCAFLSGQYNWQWNNGDCTVLSGFVCSMG